MSADGGEAGPRSRDLPRRHPLVAGFLLLLLVGWSIYGSLTGLLAGMHREDLPAADISTLTGGVVAWSTPDQIDEALVSWADWDVQEVATTGGGERLHESPQTIVGVAMLVDLLMILPGYVVVLLFATRRLRQKIGEQEPDAKQAAAAGITVEDLRDERSRWIVAVDWLRRAVVVGAAFDVVENVLVLVIVNRDDPGTFLSWALVGASRAKAWPLLLAVLGVLYVALLRPAGEEGRRWATDLPKYLRGIAAVRVAIVPVLLTYLAISGPAALVVPEQLEDVIRRWNVPHVVFTAFFVVLTSALAGVSARRTRLRIVRKTHRGEPFTYLALRNEADQADADEAFWEKAKGRTSALGVGMGVAGVLGLVAHATLGVGIGFVVPALIVALLGVAGIPLPMRKRPLSKGGTTERKIAEITPRLLAAAIPAIIGFGILGAVVPELALADRRPSLWPIALSVMVGAAAAGVFAVIQRFAAKLARRSVDDVLIENAATGVLGAITLGVIALIVLAIVADVPDFDQAMQAPWLVLLGVVFVAVAFVVFYFFAEPDIDPPPMEPLRPGPAVLLPGTGEFRDLSYIKRSLQLVVLTGTLIIVAFWVYASPLRGPQLLGGVGVAVSFVFLASLGIEGAARFVEKAAPPKVLEYLGVKRIPVIVFGVVWVFVMATWLPNKGFHDVELVDASSEAIEVRDPAVSVEDAWDRWLATNGLPPIDELPDGPVADSRAATPMLFVSAWGGGIRAAVWTAYVLDCALEPHADAAPWEGPGSGRCRVADDSAVGSVAAMSGISGGSLGFAEYFAQLTAFPSAPERSHAWVRTRLSDDYLSPALARMVYVDAPFGLIGVEERLADRGDILRQAWEASWEDADGADADGENALGRGMFDLWAGEPQLPVAVMNGASMNDACSINVSPLSTHSTDDDRRLLECTTLAPFDGERVAGNSARDFGGTLAATHDVAAFLCDNEDIPLSAAALMSARFPPISPTGRLEDCRDAPGLPDAIYTTDGGQLELSGSLTATQLWAAFEPYVTAWNARSGDRCIAPALIHMENGFSADANSTSAAPPNEWLDPLLWVPLGNPKSGLVANARQREALEFRKPLAGGVVVRSADAEVPRYVFIRTRAHPGPTAPLGWTLSEATFEDLAAQLGQNALQFDVVAQWLSGDLTCDAMG